LSLKYEMQNKKISLGLSSHEGLQVSLKSSASRY
jgi:hypothetical protein